MNNLGEKIDDAAFWFCITCSVLTVMFGVGILVINIIPLFQ